MSTLSDRPRHRAPGRTAGTVTTADLDLTAPNAGVRAQLAPGG